MAEQLQVPMSMGGLVRYNQEYDSPFRINPSMVIVFVVLIIAFVLVLKYFFPLTI